MKHAYLCAMAATTLLLTGCDKKQDWQGDTAPLSDKTVPVVDMATPAAPTNPDEVVASVNDAKLLRKEMDRIVTSLMESQNIPPEHQNEARGHFEERTAQTFIIKSLLLAEAGKQGIATTEEERKEQMDKIAEMLKQQGKTMDEYLNSSPLGESAARAELEEGMLIDKLLKQEVINKITLAPEEVKEAMDEIVKENAEADEFNKSLETINKEKRAQIEDIKKQLENNGDFAELARNKSDCPSSQKGGELGEFTRGQMVKPFEDVAFSQEVGKVSDIVETQFGYHLIKVTDKKPAQKAKDDAPARPESVSASHILIKTEEAKPTRKMPTSEQMEERLKQRKSRDLIQSYIEGLKASAKIETIFTEMQL